MKTYPRLSEMGVKNPEQISDFSINSIDYSDYLRITYERPKGSSLAYSHTYKFPRKQKTAKLAGSRQENIVLESSTAFRDAVGELQQIIGAKKSAPNHTNAILDELQKLEEDFAIRCSRLKELIGKSKVN